jgi:hypothetical protein
MEKRMTQETVVATKHLRLRLVCHCGTQMEVPVEHLPKVFKGDKKCPTCENNWDFPAGEDETINPYHALTVAVDHIEKLPGLAVAFVSAEA